MQEQLQTLLEHLESREHIDTIYFNEEGGWLFHQHPSFPISRSREETIAQLKDALSVEEKPFVDVPEILLKLETLTKEYDELKAAKAESDKLIKGLDEAVKKGADAYSALFDEKSKVAKQLEDKTAEAELLTEGNSSLQSQVSALTDELKAAKAELKKLKKEQA